MGREIRRVPPTWKHPTQACPHVPVCDHPEEGRGRCYQPLFDEAYEVAAEAWLNGLDRWRRTKRKQDEPEYFWDWDGMPPDKEYYRPAWKAGEATHYQVYETVSEGTPVTPHFATKEELIEYLVTHGDFWDQRRGLTGWAREHAERFVNAGHAASCVVEVSAAGVRVKEPRDGA